MRPGNNRFTVLLKKYFEEKFLDFELKFAFLYGSRGQDSGRVKANSDIDIAVVFANTSLSQNEMFDRIMEISYTLSGLIGIDVDIIVIDPDFSKPMLFYNAIVHGTPLLITDELEYLKLREEAIYQMEDFKIFGIQWQHMIIEKNLEALKHA